MSDIVPHKLKVTELRDELKKRGLDTKGKKEQLVKRLLKALGVADEAGADDSMAAVDESDVSQVCDTSSLSTTDIVEQPPSSCDRPVNGSIATEAAASDSAAMEESAEPVVAEPLPSAEACPPVAPEAAVAVPAGEAASRAAESCTTEADESTARAESLSETTAGCALYTLPGSESSISITSNQQSAAEDSAPAADSASATSHQQPNVEESTPAADSASGTSQQQPDVEDITPASDSASATSIQERDAGDSTPHADSASITTRQQTTTEEAGAAAAAVVQSETHVSCHADADSGFVAAVETEDSPMLAVDPACKLESSSTGGKQSTADPTVLQPDHEIDVKMEQDTDAPSMAPETLPANSVGSSAIAIDGSGDTTVQIKEPADNTTAKVDSRRAPSKERRSRSPRRRSRSPVEKPSSAAHAPSVAEDDSWLASEDVQIDRYNSDLNLVIKDAYTTVPLCQAGFAYMWAGSKATHGVTSGKVVFEMKVVDEPQVDLPADDKIHNVARIGWSFDSGSTMLGEDKTSWGYGGTGKISHANSFKDYGKPFAKGDVITAYLDLDGASAVMAFSKNGQDLGTAYEIPKSEIKGAALFPTIFSKNTEVTLNFGQKEASHPLREGFVFIGHVARDQLVRAALPPQQKSDAEVLMLIGLPGAGKTYWAAKHCEAHPEKRFNVLGTNAIIDKMKVSGLYRKFNYAGRWDVLFDKSNKCLSKLIELACSKRRNYIIDQTNVYASAQKRKMKPFEGFRRKAVVVVPSEDEFRVRVAKRTRNEGKEVPEEAVTEMKANFSVPHVGDVFDEVLYPELPEAEVRKLVAQYVKEGQARFPPGSRRFNDHRQGPSYDGSSNRDVGRDRGFSGPREIYRNDRSSYGGNYRSGGGFNDGNSGFGNARSERGYYPTQNPSFSSGDRGYGGVQNTSFGPGGGHVGQQQRPWDGHPRSATGAASAVTGLQAGGGGVGGSAPAGGAGGWGAGGWAGNQVPHPYGASGPYSGSSSASVAGGYRGGQAPAANSQYGSRYDSYTGRSGSGYGSQSGSVAPVTASPGGYGPAASGSYGGAASGSYGGSASGGYGGSASGGYGTTASGGYGRSASGGYGGSAPGGYGGSAPGGYGSGSSSSTYGNAAPSGSYAGAPASGGYGSSVPSGGYGSAAVPAVASVANPPGSYSRAQPSSYGSSQPGGPVTGSYGSGAQASAQPQSYGSHSAGYSSGQSPHSSSYGSQASSAGSQARGYGSGGAYGSAQGGYGGWSAPPPNQGAPARTAAAAAPAVASQQQQHWAQQQQQQQYTGGSSWPQPSPSSYGGYGQRR